MHTHTSPSRLSTARALLPLLLTLLALQTACEKDQDRRATTNSPTANAPKNTTDTPSNQTAALSPADQAWQQASALADDDEKAEPMRIAALKGFISKHPQDPRRKQARERIATLKASLNKDNAAWASTTAVHMSIAKSKDLIQQQQLTSDPDTLLDFLVFALINKIYAPSSAPELTPHLTLTSPTGESLEASKQYNPGLGSTRNQLEGILLTSLSSLGPKNKLGQPQRCKYNDKPCQLEVFNALANKLTGTALFKSDARLDPRGLSKLLARIDRASKREAILGSTAPQIYKALQPSFREYALTYKELTKKPGRAKALAAFKKAARKHEAYQKTGYNNDMMEWYYSWTRDQGFKQRVLIRSYGHYVAVGFWLRRMNDGTDKKIAGLLFEKIKELDPAFYKKELR